jgi:hypothetical protein
LFGARASTGQDAVRSSGDDSVPGVAVSPPPGHRQDQPVAGRGR